MTYRDRSVIKALLQKMTDGFLVGTDEFRAAIVHFNIGTTIQTTIPGRFNQPEMFAVDAFCPESIARNPNGQRSMFMTLAESDRYSEDIRATGDTVVQPAALTLIHQKE